MCCEADRSHGLSYLLAYSQIPTTTLPQQAYDSDTRIFWEVPAAPV